MHDQLNPFMILTGHTLNVLRAFADDSIQCIVTSPPYWKLRDYLNNPDQLGHEAKPDCLRWASGMRPCSTCYVCALRKIFKEIKRVLRPDGTVWLNLGDSYVSKQSGKIGKTTQMTNRAHIQEATMAPTKRGCGLPDKQLVMIPQRVGLAMQADGWFVRNEIIWNKPNPQPESVKDRCTRSHETIWLLSKKPTYYYDYKAISEEATTLADLERRQQNGKSDWTRVKKEGYSMRGDVTRDRSELYSADGMRNKRDVWTVSNRPSLLNHKAMFPKALIEPCILAGSREGDIVLDVFSGAATTGIVSLQYGRKYIGIEINAGTAQMSLNRLKEYFPIAGADKEIPPEEWGKHSHVQAKLW